MKDRDPDAALAGALVVRLFMEYPTFGRSFREGLEQEMGRLPAKGNAKARREIARTLKAVTALEKKIRRRGRSRRSTQ